MEFHPAANLFPLMGEVELAELSRDIAEHGLHNSVVTHDGMILDGRNRYRACQLAGIEPRFREWDGTGSPTAWVLSENLYRRHLTQSQKAAVAVEALPLFKEEAKERQREAVRQSNIRRSGGEIPVPALMPELEDQGEAREFAAKSVGVSPRYVQDAKAISEEAPELFEQVKAGDITITAAKRQLAGTPEPKAPKPEAEKPKQREEFPTLVLRRETQAEEYPVEPGSVEDEILTRIFGRFTVDHVTRYPALKWDQWADIADRLRSQVAVVLADYEIERKAFGD